MATSTKHVDNFGFAPSIATATVKAHLLRWLCGAILPKFGPIDFANIDSNNQKIQVALP